MSAAHENRKATSLVHEHSEETYKCNLKPLYYRCHEPIKSLLYHQDLCKYSFSFYDQNFYMIPTKICHPPPPTPTERWKYHYTDAFVGTIKLHTSHVNQLKSSLISII